MTEDEARRVLLARAFESGAATSVWTLDDRAWATRASLQDLGSAQDFERFVVVRAGHALQRLLPRDAAARRWIDRRRWPARGLLAATVLLSFALGLLADRIGPQQRIDLLAPAVWLIVLWNLGVYGMLLLPWRARRLPGWSLRAAGPAAIGASWATQAAPLTRARMAALLHVAAALLAAGLIAGLYLRGLGHDYRAGWQSTFLDASTVQAALSTLLAPAAALTGIAVPDVAPLRMLPGSAPAGHAAPWIHLFAATLVLAVVLPRLLLAAIAAGRARSLARRFPLALDGMYFDRLRLLQRGEQRLIAEVQPHAAAPSAQAALGLRALLALEWGAGVELRFADPLPYGDEDQAARAAAPGATLRLALFDLAATPEPETHGKLLAALAGSLPLVAIVDEAAFKRRFAAMPERLRERRALWKRLAEAHGVRVVCVDLEGDVQAAAADLKAALA
ncbi:DUF2868 domain-containing protein [Aquincola sp. S2]|uniref:DUF2868 domain-containing protein n=1 Tax=Pseudaquabacterium terrae TaxID=2732868 RepID=A0ABX2EPS9_9BURK|nr:DUF2868 domain-containing protein [Aquabacterium terrae]NRF70710.1 DUF2868 domain-containing protein [Aquabacterium terrae]